MQSRNVAWKNPASTERSPPQASRSNPPKVDFLPKRAEQVVFWAARNDSGTPKQDTGTKPVHFSKVEILTGTTKMKKPMQEKNNQANRGGRKPKADPAVHRYGIKLTSEENGRFERLFAESGMRQKAAFIKKSVFGGKVKVVKIDKATMDYYVRLTEFHRQFQAIGNNYNQVVRAVKNNFGEKRAMALLHKLEKATLELILISKKIILLTQEYEKKWLQK